MKFLPIFSILTIILLLGSLTIFFAQSLLFLLTQIFYEVYATSGAPAAYLETIALIILTCSIIFLVIQKKFSCIIVNYKGDGVKEGGLERFKVIGKSVLGLILFELLKLYLKKRKHG